MQVKLPPGQPRGIGQVYTCVEKFIVAKHMVAKHMVATETVMA